MPDVTKKCEECGKAFEVSSWHPNRRFCTKLCNTRSYKRRNNVRLTEYMSKWNAENKDRRLLKIREWHAANPGWGKEWREKNKVHRKKYSEAYRKTPKYNYSYYKTGAKQRGIEFSLTMEEFVAFWKQPCVYCGDNIESIGLDRIDNGIGYREGNVVPCCTVCNFSKWSRSTDDFIAHCIRVANHNGRGA